MKWLFLALLLTTRVLAAPTVAEQLESANEALQRGDAKEAITLATAAIAAEPSNATAFATRAAAYEATRDFERAAADHAKTVELMPAATGAYVHMGEDHY